MCGKYAEEDLFISAFVFECQKECINTINPNSKLNFPKKNDYTICT